MPQAKEVMCHGTERIHSCDVCSENTTSRLICEPTTCRVHGKESRSESGCHGALSACYFTLYISAVFVHFCFLFHFSYLRPLFATLRMPRTTMSAARLSSPLVGSSRNRTLGLAT